MHISYFRMLKEINVNDIICLKLQPNYSVTMLSTYMSVGIQVVIFLKIAYLRFLKFAYAIYSLYSVTTHSDLTCF